jgi:hypothetical protein
VVSSTNKTDCHDITDILLKVALNTTTITLNLIIDYVLFEAVNLLSLFQKSTGPV